MGGTRCIFRDCQVSTQRNPKMHFFKLPVRDPVRLKAWLKNCGNSALLNIDREKLANRAICARHFRYECFMNYKLDRLMPNQTPTLARISKDLAWDMEHLDENGEATMVKLSMPTLKHLIPPENFECPLGFMEDARFGRKYVARRRTPPKPLPMNDIKKPKIMSDLQRTDIVDLTQKCEKVDFERSIETKQDDTVSAAPGNSADFQRKNAELQVNLERLATENAALKKSLEKFEAQHLAVASAPSSVPTPAPASAAAPQLSKPQLYNNIKKYLGPSMAALVRMEMFGGGERDWQQDEQDFAKELLQLGEHFYTHCCEEWRFRLPSLRLTRGWLSKTEPTEAANPDV